MKKTTALFLALCIGGFLYAGGGSQNSSGTGPVKLTAIIVSHELTRDVITMQWLKELEKSANVSIEWRQISTGWNDQKAAVFASGDIPDLLFSAATESDFQVYSGLFEDLAPHIENNAPNIKKMFSELPAMKALVTNLEGKIFGLAAYNGTAPNIRSPQYINKQWLDRVNKKVPATWDELKDVLIAFRDQDANGNGDRDDEIPMDTRPLNEGHSSKYLIGSLGVPLSNSPDDGYFAEGGKIKNYWVDERFKTLVLFFRDLYAEKLINSEVFTQDYSQFQSLARGNGNYAKIGFTNGFSPTDRLGVQLADQYIVLPPLKQHADSQGPVFFARDVEQQRYQTNRFSLSARTKNKTAAVKFIDLFFDPAIGMQVFWGGMNDIDKGIKNNGNGSYTVLPPPDPSMAPGVWRWTNSFSQQGSYYIPDNLKITPDTETADNARIREPYQDQIKLFNSSNTYPFAFMKYTVEETRTMALNQTNLSNIINRYAAWIVGQGDVTAEWDAYVRSAMDAGLKENLEIRQKAFDIYLKQQ
jgi:putative aldouronate transport system substrate-binding protein